MFSAKNGLNLLVGKNISRSTPVQVTDRSAATFIADGEIVVLKSDGTAITAGETITDTEWIQLVQRSGGTAATAQLVYSPRIFGQWVTAYTGKDGVAAVEQVTHIGSNGTTGSIDTTDEARLLHLTYTFNEGVWSEQAEHRVFQFVGTAPTQPEIAESFARQINADLATKVSAVVLTDEAGTAEGDTATVTNGSTVVTLTGTSTLVAGDFVRIGGATTASPVYKIASQTNTGTDLVLTMPYQGASAAGVTVETITAAAAVVAGVDFGIQITGLPLTYTTGFFKYLKTTFVIGLPVDGWETTTLTYTTAASRGTGVYEQIAELEWFALGEEGALNRTRVPLPTGRQDATSGALYDVIAIHFYDASDLYAVSGTKPSPRLLYVAIVDGAAQGATLVTELDPWMASTPRNFAGITI